MDKYLKHYEISSTHPEFDFITNALQEVMQHDKLKITKDGFEMFLNELEKSLYHEDISIYLENHYAEAEYNRGYDDGYRDGYYEAELDWKE